MGLYNGTLMRNSDSCIRYICALGLQAMQQARCQIRREQRRIARHRQQVRGLATHEARLQASQGTGKICRDIAAYRQTPCAVGWQVLVGVDQQVLHLGLEPVHNV